MPRLRQLFSLHRLVPTVLALACIVLTCAMAQQANARQAGSTVMIRAVAGAGVVDADDPLPPGVSIPEATSSVTATITETGDEAELSIDATASVTEGQPMVFTLRLTNRVEQALTVGWSTADGVGANPANALGSHADYTASADTVTIRRGALTATIEVPTGDDDLLEPDETFTLTLDTTGTLPDGVTFGSGSTATGTIVNDEGAARVSIDSIVATEGDDLVFTALLDQLVGSDVNLDWGTRNLSGAGFATPDVDYMPTSGRVTIPAGVRSVDFTIETVDDTDTEEREIIPLTLAGVDLPSGVTALGVDGGGYSASGTILDNETGAPPLLLVQPASATEGQDVVFTVMPERPLAQEMTVIWRYADGGTAQHGFQQERFDDLPSAGSLPTRVVIPAGAAGATFSVPTIADNLAEGDETFRIALIDQISVNLGGFSFRVYPETFAIVEGTIIDDDDGSIAQVGISVRASAVEGDTLAFRVNMQVATDEPFDLFWTTQDGTAIGGQHFTPTQGSVRVEAGVAGEQAAVIRIQTEDDAIANLARTFRLNVDRRPLPAGLNYSTTEGRGTILDNDHDDAPIVLQRFPGNALNFTGETLGFFTGNITTIGFELSKGNTGDEPLIVNIVPRSDNTLTEGQDYRLLSRQIIVPAHTSSFRGTVGVQIIDDSVTETREEIAVFDLVVVSSHDVELVGGLPPTILVRDSDFTRIRLSEPASAVEGDMIVFTAELDYLRTTGGGTGVVEGPGSVDRPFELLWTATDGTATVADDLGMQSGTVTIPALSQTATISIPIVDDAEFEEDATSRATGTITEDDAATVSIAEAAEAEEGSPVEFEVNLSAASMAPVTVRWTATATGDGAATLEGDGSDLATGQVLTGTVEFATDDTAAKTVSLATVDDDRVEGSETFTVTLSPDDDNPLPDGVTIPTATEAGTGTITEDDMATVSITPEADTRTEGDPFAFEVQLSAPVDEAVTVTWTAVAGTAAVRDPNSDLAPSQAITGTASFAAGATTAVAVPIATLDDDRVEGEEAFTVTLSGDLPTGVDYGTQTATGTITEDDMATVSITETAEAAEGSPVEFAVSLSAASSLPVTVRWTATTAGGDGAATLEGSGLDLADGEELTGTVEFAADDTTAKTVSLATVNDDRVEGSETFTVTLSPDTDTPLPAGVTIPSAGAAATGTITEDDMAELSIADGSGAEGFPVVFEVSLSAAAMAGVTVRWTATPAAPAAGAATLEGTGSDLASGEVLTGTVEFAADDNAVKTVRIATVDDALVEGSETFTVTLSPDTDTPLPDGVSIPSAGAAATGTITEDETAVLSITSAATAAEGAAVEFAIDLSAASQNAVTVRWTATSAGGDGSATLSGARSDLTDGHAVTGTVEFAANDTVKTVRIATVDDTRVEGSETFTVTLSEDTIGGNLLPGGVDISDTLDTGTGTITEDDAAEVSIADGSGAEGLPVVFDVSLSAASSKPVRVRWTATTAGGVGAATLEGDDSDLTDNHAVTGTVEFAANDTVETVSLATVDDALVEGSEPSR